MCVFPTAEPPVLSEIRFPENIVEGMRISVACSLMSGDLPISLRCVAHGSRSKEPHKISPTISPRYKSPPKKTRDFILFLRISGPHGVSKFYGEVDRLKDVTTVRR